METSYRDAMNACKLKPTFRERRQCFQNISSDFLLHPTKLPLFDRNSIWHGIFGLVMGIFFGFLGEIWYIIGMALIVVINLSFHWFWYGFVSLRKNRNAWMDLVLMYIGYFVSYIFIIQLVFF